MQSSEDRKEAPAEESIAAQALDELQRPDGNKVTRRRHPCGNRRDMLKAPLCRRKRTRPRR
jgi:hypothetical protein